METCISYLKSVPFTVLELLAFNLRYAHTDRQTEEIDRQTSDENIISSIHSVHLAEIVT